jgi:hypothetical protein
MAGGKPWKSAEALKPAALFLFDATKYARLGAFTDSKQKSELTIFMKYAFSKISPIEKPERSVKISWSLEHALQAHPIARLRTFCPR